ncbi:MAG: type II toxin-antitoxin system HicA family toxin [Dehalococcoidia bacterium]
MKRGDLIRHLRDHGCELRREGSLHSLWWNPGNGVREPIPRHSEIPDLLVRKICRRMGVPPPK